MKAKIIIKKCGGDKTDRAMVFMLKISNRMANSRTSDGIYVVSKYKVKVGDKVKSPVLSEEGYMEEVTLGAGRPLLRNDE